MAQVFFQPGVVSAGTDITLPSDAPPFYRLVRAVNIDTGNYPNTSAVNPTVLTIVDTAPTGNQIQLTAPNKVKLGSATTVNTNLLLVGIAYGERVMVA